MEADLPAGEAVTCHEAAVFKPASGKLFLYRSKNGDWVVGRNISKPNPAAGLIQTKSSVANIATGLWVRISKPNLPLTII